jgi:hypothetical protein
MKTTSILALLSTFTTMAITAVDSANADTILLFENSSGLSFGAIPQDYGSRVTANIQNGYHYGGTANTPHIVASYVNAAGWPSGYGDLTNVCYPFGASSPILSIKLTADPGYQVALQSFDLAGWPNTDYTINSVQVRDGNGSVLYSAPNLLVQGDSVGSPHTALSFAPLVSSTLQISVDATNITASFGAENIGLDNLRFSQVPVPEPASIATALSASLIGAVILLGRHRWKNAHP